MVLKKRLYHILSYSLLHAISLTTHIVFVRKPRDQIWLFFIKLFHAFSQWFTEIQRDNLRTFLYVKSCRNIKGKKKKISATSFSFPKLAANGVKAFFL